MQDETDFLRGQMNALYDQIETLRAENAKLIAERDGYKVRGDGHWETLKSVREIAKEGDLERVIQWVNDAGGGYTEPNEMTLSKLMDENQKLLTELKEAAFTVCALLAEREAMMKQEPSDQALLQLGMDQPWPMLHCVKKLIECADILLNEKRYDRTGHEYMSEAMRQAKNYIATWRPLPAQQIPEGYALVPIEPTEEMRDAANKVDELATEKEILSSDHFMNIYKAMVLSASQPKVEEWIEVPKFLRRGDD